MNKKLFKYTSILIIVIFFLISIISCKASVIQERKSTAQNIEESDNGLIDETDTTKLNGESTSKTESQSIDVDKGLFNVEITLPASFFEGQDIDNIVSEMKDEGVKVAINDDGSVTYKMSKAKHNEFMKELDKSIVEYIEEIKNSGDYKSIQDITYNKSFSEITLTVEKEAFENSLDGIVSLGIGMMSLYYQLFNGVSQENYRVQINFKDTETGNIFNNVVYPDAFEE